MLGTYGCLGASPMHMYQNKKGTILMIEAKNLCLLVMIQEPKATSCMIQEMAKLLRAEMWSLMKIEHESEKLKKNITT